MKAVEINKHLGDFSTRVKNAWCLMRNRARVKCGTSHGIKTWGRQRNPNSDEKKLGQVAIIFPSHPSAG